jgi:hypothetical protein
MSKEQQKGSILIEFEHRSVKEAWTFMDAIEKFAESAPATSKSVTMRSVSKDASA